MKRTPLLNRTPLKRRTGLKHFVNGLLRRKALKPMSARAREELKIWREVVRRRVQALLDKFGFIPCEYCHQTIREGSQIDGHHNNHDRRNNTFENCRITHPYCNRVAIEDGNVKDVPSLL